MSPRSWRAALALWALLALAPAGAEPQLPLPLPRDTQISIVGEDLAINGLSMQVYELRSALSPPALLEFYAEEWSGRTRTAHLPPWTILSHPHGDYLVTVQLRRLPGDASFGYVGITNLLAPDLRLRRSNFPVAPGGELLNDIQAQDQGRRSRAALLRSRASIAQTLDWYENHYRRHGWHRISAADAGAQVPGRSTLLMNKGSGELNLVAVRDGDESLVTIVLVEP